MKLGGSTLLAQAIARGQACGADEVLVVTNDDHLHLSRAEVRTLTDTPDVHYLLEPQGRNTAPAIALAALHCLYVHGPDTVMLVLPADHLIPDQRAFVACAVEAEMLAQQGRLVVFGVEPTSPEPGYGYIEVDHVGRHSQPVRRFVEKPDAATAQAYLASGRYLWNSGMFCFTASAIADAFARYAPHVMGTARGAAKAARTTGDITRYEPHAFALQPDISIDYAVMEKAQNVTVVPARFAWSDAGTWPALAASHPPDAAGNTFLADVVAVDTHGTHVQTEAESPKVVATVGVNDLVIVDTADALLVAAKADAQKIRGVVKALQQRGHPSTQRAQRVQQTWGSHVVLKEHAGYLVRLVTIRSGESLQLQYHQHRAKHLAVVEGEGVLQIGDEQHKVEPGHSRFVPRSVKHRLANTGTDDLVVVSVELGTSLADDDTLRLQDPYDLH